MFSAQTQGILAEILANVLWGFGGPIVKVALYKISPLTFVAIRMVFSVLILFPFVFPRLKKQNFDKNDCLMILVIGLLGITFNIGFYFLGLSLTSMIDTSVIISTTSIFTAVAAFLFLKEKISRIVSVGIVLSFAGTVVIILQPILEKGLFSSGNLLGNLLILLSTLTWVAYVILNKEIAKKYDSLVLVFIYFIIGTISFVPFAAKDIFRLEFYQSLSPFLIFALAYETIFATVICYFLVIWGLKYVTATTAGIITYINPVISIIASILFLGEKVTATFLIGTVLVASGLFLAETRHPKHPLHIMHNLLSFPRKRESI
ncbi:MAG: DMT family transporter [Patescibacteria group bacterium]|nr:DMT family transporter [Patescibacteria group bacterium]